MPARWLGKVCRSDERRDRMHRNGLSGARRRCSVAADEGAAADG